MQQRYGPNRAGPFGLLQPIADLDQADPQGELLPRRRERPAVHHRAGRLRVHRARRVRRDPVRARAGRSTAGTSTARSLDVPIALILVFALGSIGVYGFIVGGWASESKYSLLGSMRTCAQLVSYEVSLALSVLGVVLMGQSLALTRHRLEAGGDALVRPPAGGRLPRSSSSAASPSRRARRSTCPRRTASSSPATTPSTRACAGASSRWPSTST